MAGAYDFKKIKDICTYLTDTEGKISHVKICDVRELVGILSGLLVGPCSVEVLEALLKNGRRRTR